MHVLAPAALAYVPAGHAEGTDAPPAHERPAGQGMHWLAVPVLDAKVPPGQGVHAALPAVEKAPAGQVVTLVAPSGQAVPATHVAQLARLVAPTEVENVPAGHQLQKGLAPPCAHELAGHSRHAPV